MKTQQKQVADWMRKFGQEVRDTPTIPPLEERKLRAKLILEEALETIKALGIDSLHDSMGCICDFDEVLEALGRCQDLDWGDCHTPKLTKIADGIADSLVVQLGTAVACGIDITPVFDEVMRSNHSKLWSDDNDLDNDKVAEMKAQGCTFTLVAEHPECDVSLYLCKDKDGKVIKSPSYSPANITL